MADTPGLDIINLALSHLKMRPITQIILNADSTLASQAALRAWAPTLKETLASQDWGFACVEVALVASAVEPVNYDYSYVIPTDCVAIRRIWNESTEMTTIGENFIKLYDTATGVNVIATDCEDAYIRYTHYVNDPDLFDPHFVTTFSHRLAAEMALPLTGDANKAKSEIVVFNTMISEASKHNATQTKEQQEGNEKANFVDARS